MTTFFPLNCNKILAPLCGAVYHSSSSTCALLRTFVLDSPSRSRLHVKSLEFICMQGKENSTLTPLPPDHPPNTLSTSPHKQQHTHIESGRESERHNQTFGFYSICSISIYVNVLCLCGQSKCKCCYKLIKVKINIFSNITKENKTKVNNSSDEMGRRMGSSREKEKKEAGGVETTIHFRGK